MQRNLTGYGASPPPVVWPNGARIAISVVVNYEEGSERSPLDGDAAHEVSGDIRSSRPPEERDLQTESQWEYGARAGVWRLLRLLKRHEIDATFFLCAVALERNPGLAEAIADHDICGHGYRWIPQWQLDREEESASIAAAVKSIMSLTGRHPLGWFTKGGPSLNTRELLAEQGFLYDSDGLNDDLPYYTEVRGKPWLVVPYDLDSNDGGYWHGRWASGKDFSSYLRAGFDYLYEEGKDVPKMLSIGLHSKVSGRPGRAAALNDFFEYAKGFPDVWFARRSDIARWWMEQFPPETGNFR